MQISDREMRRRQLGQGTLEFMLVLLVLIPLLLGGIELARGVSLRHSLASGVHIATRTLSLDPDEWPWAYAIITQSVTDNVLGGGSASPPAINIYNDGGGQITPAALSGLPFGTPFRLEAEVTYTPDIPLVGGSGVTIRTSHWGIMERYP